MNMTEPLSDTGDRSRLQSIQILRAVAALSVLYSHVYIFVWAPLHGIMPTEANLPFDFGGAGVQLFFVISGFIICHICNQQTFSIRSFALKRIMRIYPTYLVLNLLLISALLVIPELSSGPLTWSKISTGLSIFPDEEAPILAPGWTLEHELIFYGIVGLLYSANRRAWLAPLMTCLFCTGVIVHLVMPKIFGHYIWDYHLLSLSHYSFLLGVLIFNHRNFLHVFGVVTPLLLCSLLYSVIVLVIRPRWYTGEPSVDFFYEVVFYGTAGGLLLIACINTPTVTSSVSRGPLYLLILIGDASYILYLLNWIVLKTVWKVQPLLHLQPDHAILYMALAFISCVVLSIVLHLYIERRFLVYAHSSLFRPDSRKMKSAFAPVRRDNSAALP